MTRATLVSTGPQSPRPPLTQTVIHSRTAIIAMINPRREKMMPVIQLISSPVSLPKTDSPTSSRLILGDFSVKSWWHIARIPRSKAATDTA